MDKNIRELLEAEINNENSERPIVDDEEADGDEELEEGMIEDEGEEDVFDPDPAESRGRDPRPEFYVGKDNTTKWFTSLPESARPNPLILTPPLPSGNAVGVRDPLALFHIFMTDDILELIVKHTNTEIELRARQYNRKQWYLEKTDKIELRAYIGLLYIAGLMKSGHLPTTVLWSKKFGPVAFRNTMNKNRFEFLTRCLRFDNRNDRIYKKVSKKITIKGKGRTQIPKVKITKVYADKFCPFREVWEMFNRNCRRSYRPSNRLTVDETVLGFDGRVSFKKYNPNKPDRRGMEIQTLCDSSTAYYIHGEPYLGAQAAEQDDPSEPSTSSTPSTPSASSISARTDITEPTKTVLKLTEPFHDQPNRKIVTCDNYFCSVELANELLERGCTLVGTMKKSRRELPPQTLETKNVMECEFLYQKNKVLVSYAPKPSKMVVLLSSEHISVGSIDEETQKPEINIFYNKNKGAVDTLNKCMHSRTTSRKTRRWPLRYFFGVLDILANNAFIIQRLNSGDPKITRLQFIEDLADGLIYQHVLRRLNIPYLPRLLRSNIREMLGMEEQEIVRQRPPPGSDEADPRKGRCYLCPRSSDRKGANLCERCFGRICSGQHSLHICPQCFDQ